MFEPQVSNYRMASGSDDCTCRLWDIAASTEVYRKNFSSPVTSVKWNMGSGFETTLLISQLNGDLNLLDLRHPTKISCSFEVMSQKHILIDADWSLVDAHYIAAIASGHWFVWDQRNPSTPLHYSSNEILGRSQIRFSLSDPSIFATCSSTDLFYHDTSQSLPQLIASQLSSSSSSSFSWLNSLLVCFSPSSLFFSRHFLQ